MILLPAILLARKAGMFPHRLDRTPVPPGAVKYLEEAIRARGWCIGGYAQVEFVLGDFIIRSTKLPGYEDLGLSFPYRFESRVERVRQIAARPGALSSFSQHLIDLTDAITSWTDVRIMLSHGWMALEGGPTLKFARFAPTAENDRAQITMCLTLEEIRDIADVLTEISSEALRLCDDIYTLFELVD